ncbi:methyltransferase domain-containing protein [Robertkochia aurantiaca]|uniref:methyltransferase domain-containing protein n=1 Tax=Robertkochia aurantiaca TaxID=2873700 RepID=UPI001CCE9339|nr:methyltransferase domain-containing protein [Robertkochia sp. 3YJGBD-33]
MLIDLEKRQHGPEEMDNPDLAEADIKAVLEDINKVNRLLNGHAPLVKWLIRDITEKNLQNVTILDAGCGDGELLRILSRRLVAAGIRARLLGVDLNAKSLKLARHRSKESQITYIEHDLNHEFPDTWSPHYVISNLTLHHFKDNDLESVTANFLRSASEAVVIFDLHRCRRSYYLFKIFSAIFIKTKIAVHDGLVSIRSGFNKPELRKLSERFTQADCELRWKWAFRFLMVLRPTKN